MASLSIDAVLVCSAYGLFAAVAVPLLCDVMLLEVVFVLWLLPEVGGWGATIGLNCDICLFFGTTD